MISFLLLSCSDNLLTKVYEEERSIFVFPESIDFGIVNVGESHSEKVTIINTGTKDFVLNYFESDSEDFLLNMPEEITLDPEDVLEFEIHFEPNDFGDHEGSALISHSDIYEEDLVHLSGIGASSAIQVTPESLDFGSMEEECNSEILVTIKNIGNSDLIINSISQISSNLNEMSLDFGSLGDLPWTLSPSQELDITANYSPEDIGLDQGTIFIDSNDPINPTYYLNESGEGISEQTYRDTYLQSETVMSDIIFIVDNSGSMLNIQTSLSSQIFSFMETLNTLNLDYRIGFSSTDSNYFYYNDGYYWIDNSYQNPDIWSQQVIHSIGIGGLAIERGIESSMRLLQNNSIEGAGFFLRPNANLSLIYISDEKDQSPGGWSSYTAFFDSVKNDKDMVSVFSVIGDYPSGCNTHLNGYGRNIEFGEGYYELTNYYGGSWFSICSEDWGIQLQEIASSIADRRSFELDKENPKEETITVYVNGQEVHCWQYDEDTNSVIFDLNYIPEVNQTIEIEYEVYTC